VFVPHDFSGSQADTSLTTTTIVPGSTAHAFVLRQLSAE
jgi:hypothetical protein